MKKALSILLAVIMMCSFSMIAFAAAPAVTLGEEYTVKTGEESLEYSFTPSEDGMYKLSAKILVDGKDSANADIDVLSDEDYYASVHLFYMDLSDLGIDLDLDPDFDLSFFSNSEDSDCFMAKSGTKLTVRISNDAISFGEEEYRIPDSTVTFSVTKVDNLREIKMGESYKVNGTDGEGEYFILKPTEDGVYNIWSYGCYEISVMTLDGKIEGDVASGDLPVDFTFEAKAGEMYGVYAESAAYVEGERQAEPIFHVVDATTITADVIEMDDITVVRGSDGYAFAAIYPAGARYNCKNLEVKVENEKIASAEYDAEFDMIVVHGKRIGKTTLIVTEPISGATTEVEVRVISKTADFLSRILLYISILFGRIFGR